jgi:adenosylcobinamide-phosphate synthase
MLVSIIIIIALLLDAVIGEPRRWHPLVGFGNLAIWLEQKLNNHETQSQVRLRVAGLFAWNLAVLIKSNLVQDLKLVLMFWSRLFF